MTHFYDFDATTIDGDNQPMRGFAGRWVLVVNVASRCQFTNQYQGLEALYRRHRNELAILGFPCDQFGQQEPGSEVEIKQFCALTYDVTFPMFAKVEVNGDAAHPLYRHLKQQAKGLLGTEEIKWNFTKFLIDPKGNVVRRYPPAFTPEHIEADLATALQAA
ncbi:MAG TPA: glutathione peroxidase [Dyella sp.]|uniref:glutathione peroxidase n=1 Tax=Dyella sp. TaxID=1869338 RepID=UPI002F947EED